MPVTIGLKAAAKTECPAPGLYGLLYRKRMKHK